MTGFLGSGKTTLLNRILRELPGERLAVIENEFGALGVDAEFLVTGGNETIIQLANGCLCCTVRGDLARSLQTLSASSEAGGFVFDRVLIETTGIADPGPIIQTFLAETTILTKFHLDGVVTLVDSVHALSQFDRVENRAQVAYVQAHDLPTNMIYTADKLADGWETEEGREGIAAFFGKRLPAWRQA